MGNTSKELTITSLLVRKSELITSQFTLCEMMFYYPKRMDEFLKYYRVAQRKIEKIDLLVADYQ